MFERASYQEIFPEELGEWQRRGAHLVDVREPWEYAQGHLPGAKNIPLGELPTRIDELGEPLVLVCATGNRSAQAAQYLVERGFGKVANLLGGTLGWMQRGRPIE